MVEYGASSHKINYVTILQGILDLKEQQNRMTGSRVNTTILVNGWILPIGGTSAVDGLLSEGPTPSSFNSFTNQCSL